VSEAWRGLDLGGGGLQAANIRLAQALERRSRACGLLAVFLLGLYRAYLGDPRGDWLYRAASVVAVAAAVVDERPTILIGCLIAAALVLDSSWIERRHDGPSSFPSGGNR